MKKLKEKGITLIALVVTIVVLLILAGVTIAMLTGENGIINQAKNAKEESLKSELEELVDLTLMEYQTEKAAGKDTDLGELFNSKVEKDKIFESITDDGENYIVEKNGYEVTVSKDGERITDSEKVGGVRPKLEINQSYDEGTDKVTITVKIINKSELGTVDSFKLFDSENQEVAEKTNGDDTKSFDVTKNGNYKAEVKATTDGIQKVSTITVKVDNWEMFSDIYTATKKYTDSEGNTAWIPQGFAVGVSDSINKISKGLVITDKIDAGNNSIGNEFVWVPVGNYKVGSETKKNNLTRRQWGTKVNEITVPTEVDGDIALTGDAGNYYIGESSSISNFLTKSKEKGGFYIGRYEQGIGNVVKKNVSVYNNIIREQAKSEAEGLYNNNQYVVSELISSYAWDTTLNFICQMHDEEYKIATINSNEYGNFGTGTARKNTGMYEKDKYNNIYDFLGNVIEWTTENSNTAAPWVYRGGYGSNAIFFASIRVRSYTSYTNTLIGFRTTLYVK